MPYSKFTHDIFLSYRHLDNRPFHTEKNGWITRLHEDLTYRVAQWLGSDLEVWRDCRLQGNEYFSDSIESALVGVAAFVSVISPGYEQSDWCRRELAAFLAAAEKQGGLRVGNYSRLFKVLKTPTSLHEQPAAIQSLLGYEFFHDGKEFHLDPDTMAERRYLAKLDDLAKDIHLLLKQLMAPRTAAPLPSKTQNHKAVYLAWTTSDLQDSRDKIRRELVDRDYVVLPEADPPLRADSFADSVRRALEQCQLSIHPMGSRYGLVPEGDTRSVAWLQHDLATERYKQGGGLRRILWTPKDLDIQEDNQRDFLGRIERELGGASNGFQFLKSTLEELKTIVIKQLSTEAQPAPTKVTGRSKDTQVYLICERTDRNVVQPLVSELRRNHYLVDLPDLSGDQADHQATLCECDSVLIYHGTGAGAWLREKIRDCRKAYGWGREKPFLPNGIYLGPESNEAKVEFQTDEFIVCRSLESVALPALEPYASALSHGTEAHP